MEGLRARGSVSSGYGKGRPVRMIVKAKGPSGPAKIHSDDRQRTDEVEILNQHLTQRVADQVGEIERMGRLRRFLLPQVADLIVASGTEKQLESHRREITALFCDLRGFT